MPPREARSRAAWRITTVPQRCAVWAIAGAVVLGTVVFHAGAVLGHARVLKADPGPGAVLHAPPQVVRVWFDDELDPKRSGLSVWDRRGRRVDDGRGGVDLGDLERRSMFARLRPIQRGTYTVRWRAVAADDFAVRAGAFRFVVAP